MQMTYFWFVSHSAVRQFEQLAITHLQPHHRQPDAVFLLAAAGSLLAVAEAAEVDFRRLDETFGRTSAEGAADPAFADIRGRLRQLLLQTSDMKIAARKVLEVFVFFKTKKNILNGDAQMMSSVPDPRETTLVVPDANRTALGNLTAQFVLFFNCAGFIFD
jgi:hypothetical protein